MPRQHSKTKWDGSLGRLLPTPPAQHSGGANVSEEFRKARLHTGEALIPWKARRNHGDALLRDAFPSLRTEPKPKLLAAGSLPHDRNGLLL